MASKPNLSLTLIEGEFLNDIDAQKNQGNMDPFIAIALGTQKYESKVATNQGKFPKWNETFNFIYDAKNFIVEFIAYDKDKKNQKNLLGNVSCNLLDLEKQPDWSLDLNIANNQVNQGLIRVKFDFIGKQPPPRPSIQLQPVKNAQQVQNAQQSQNAQQGSESNLQGAKSQSNDQSKQPSSNNSLHSLRNSLKQINTNPQEKQPMKRLEPLAYAKLDFKSVAYEDQQEDLTNRMKLIEEKSNLISVSKMFYAVQSALHEGLDEIRLQKPEDQVQFLGQFLLDYHQ